MLELIAIKETPLKIFFTDTEKVEFVRWFFRESKKFDIYGNLYERAQCICAQAGIDIENFEKIKRKLSQPVNSKKVHQGSPEVLMFPLIDNTYPSATNRYLREKREGLVSIRNPKYGKIVQQTQLQYALLFFRVLQDQGVNCDEHLSRDEVLKFLADERNIRQINVATRMLNEGRGAWALEFILGLKGKRIT